MRRFQAREVRFAPKVLRAYAATGLPAALALRAATGDDPTEILLYDEIGLWGVTAKDFVLALAQAGDGPIHLRINSPGGDAFEGLAIYNAMKARAAPVTVTVDGIAASAASFVAMAGSTINMPEQAMLMLHNCWGVCIGNRNDMLDMATIQEKIDGMMAEIYAAKSGKSKAELGAAMDAETWYTSSDAKAAGLCDIILPTGTQNALAGAKILARASTFRASAVAASYDPDGDGDNDAEEALGLINSAMVLLSEAAESLSGAPEDDGDEGEAGESQEDPATSGMPIVPGASAEAIAATRRLNIARARQRQAEAEVA